ncbi:uncharacterized protein UV8b_08087 [Ustilaginoidea virens]|uniref:Uncharacterized protein n=2 Tax=Ustilaginoidea virens TaxID=1159556 RepID=A0A8E5HYG5_USTVR|nr:uncharacterized protein UV8b_08087 [Ustilaginoidea virens]QUC23846.1 hypothetical protein UV8b_08087 [Ustilaginoidea virens]
MASQQPSSMSKRPRLSLQIKTACNPPLKAQPTTAINSPKRFSLQSPIGPNKLKQKVVTPLVATCPETPLSAQPVFPQRENFVSPSAMTATPPLSAGAVDTSSQVFPFSSTEASSPQSHQQVTDSLRRRNMFPLPGWNGQLPYTHSRSLQSILRNSPLPPRTTVPPPSPRRQSQRLQEKAAKKVEYDSPLEQEITTFEYTWSHIDLLNDDASPTSPASIRSPTSEPESMLDSTLAFSPNEIQDGGQTPGPFEEMTRRMAGLGAASPVSSKFTVNRKQKRAGEKRQWIWTIGQEDDDEDVGGAIAALRAKAAYRKGETQQLE